ncbi:hypothetical protein AB0K16_53375 [Nonomuraea jabiensis]|uniref:hypothetical protein n=1 Tax=Nonomuraea jabiensis TaxID=882448 RepID=UPI003442D099
MPEGIWSACERRWASSRLRLSSALAALVLGAGGGDGRARAREDGPGRLPERAIAVVHDVVAQPGAQRTLRRLDLHVLGRPAAQRGLPDDALQLRLGVDPGDDVVNVVPVHLDRLHDGVDGLVLANFHSHVQFSVPVAARLPYRARILRMLAVMGAHAATTHLPCVTVSSSTPNERKVPKTSGCCPGCQKSERATFLATAALRQKNRRRPSRKSQARERDNEENDLGIRDCPDRRTPDPDPVRSAG